MIQCWLVVSENGFFLNLLKPDHEDREILDFASQHRVSALSQIQSGNRNNHEQLHEKESNDLFNFFP